MPGGIAVAKPAPRKILLQQCELAGFQYYEGERGYPNLRYGDTLTMKIVFHVAQDPDSGKVAYGTGDCHLINRHVEGQGW